VTIDDLKKKLAAAEKARDSVVLPSADEQALLDAILAADAEAARRKARARELAEDARVTDFQSRAVAPVRIGEVRLEPGQVIFRQRDATAYRQLVATAPGPEREALAEVEFRAAILYPDAQTLATWEQSFPAIMSDIVSAWHEHTDATRRIRLGK
jgi:hypothetical protein